MYIQRIHEWGEKVDKEMQAKIFILSPKDMTSTLAKYVDIDNIPKKYGGNLDWNFGDMPNLEPAIANSLRWQENFEQNGHKTLPIGPITLQYDEDGDLDVKIVGSENGKPRNRVIAGLHPRAGVARLALSAGRVDSSKIFQTTTPAQISTPNSKAPAPVIRESKSPAPEAPESKMASDANLNVGKNPHASLSPSSRAGTYTVPYQDEENEIASPPTDGRTGTSSTRYQQQEGTHAERTLADGTPHVAVDGQGERQGVMDPNTVGQAPKEHPLPKSEEPQPSVMDQAKSYAGQAVEQAKELPTTVMSAVGMGGKEEESKEQEAKKENPEIDNMAGKNVEEFLRSQTKSDAPK